MLSITEQFKQDVKKKVKKKAKKLAATVLVPVICITVLIGGLYNSPFAIFFPSRDDASTSNNKSLISYIKSKYSETASQIYNYKTTDTCNDLNVNSSHDDYDGGVNSIEENLIGSNMQSIFQNMIMMYACQLGDGEDPCELNTAHKESVDRVFSTCYMVEYGAVPVKVSDGGTVGKYHVSTYQDVNKDFCKDTLYEAENTEEQPETNSSKSESDMNDDTDDEITYNSEWNQIVYSTRYNVIKMKNYLDYDEQYDGLYDDDTEYPEESEESNGEKEDDKTSENPDTENSENDNTTQKPEVDPEKLYTYDGKTYQMTEEEDSHLPYAIVWDEAGNSEDFPFSCAGSVITINGTRYEVVENTAGISLNSAVTLISQPGRGEGNGEFDIDDMYDVEYDGTEDRTFYRKKVTIDALTVEECMDELNFTQNDRNMYKELEEAFRSSEFASVFSNIISVGSGTISGDTIAQQIWNYFVTTGYSEKFTAAIMGNMYEESRFDPAAVAYNSSGGVQSVGLVQWDTSGGRYQLFMQFCEQNGTEWTDLETQLKFVVHEFSGNYAQSYEDINAVEDFDDMVRLYHRLYENSADGEKGIQERVDAARQIYEMYQGTSSNNIANGLDGNPYSLKQLQGIFSWITDDMPFFIDTEAKVTSPYTASTRTDVDSSITNTSAHGGIDFHAATGTQLFALADGVVTHSGWQNGQHSGKGSGYGIYVQVECSDGTSYIYGHMSETAVSVGEDVVAGQILGLSGGTGEATGPHVHLTLYDTSGNRVNDNALGRLWDSGFNSF